MELEEKMLDYEDDPLTQEKWEMAHNDRIFERRQTICNVLKLPVITEKKMDGIGIDVAGLQPI